MILLSTHDADADADELFVAQSGANAYVTKSARGRNLEQVADLLLGARGREQGRGADDVALVLCAAELGEPLPDGECS
ncbi:hypothetical protein P0Y31_07830 [Knoellia sp. 3-2P3]|uniref:hypothetical protein n=1 Tax=unclassified Knoellia TaxID=2618719 RepID=UPI0023DB6DCA|nr:hypothetical protein [Knoellia sp. 3-2P3]MDF2092250.1 hypothetical protein [Knoellia sp. 3-2P3]